MPLVNGEPDNPMTFDAWIVAMNFDGFPYAVRLVDYQQVDGRERIALFESLRRANLNRLVRPVHRRASHQNAVINAVLQQSRAGLRAKYAPVQNHRRTPALLCRRVHQRDCDLGLAKRARSIKNLRSIPDANPARSLSIIVV